MTMPLPRARHLLVPAAFALALAGCSPAPEPAPEPASTPPSASVTAAATPAATPARPAPALPRRVVGLGDSIMAGTNCACDGPLAALADAIEREHGARPEVSNLGVPGWTTDDLLRFVTTDADARAEVAAADTVVVIIGANDLFRMGAASGAGTDTAELASHVEVLDAGVDAALAAVREAAGDGPGTYLVAGYWDILAPSGRSSTESAGATAAVNATLRSSAEDAGMEFVDLHAAFDAAGDIPALISDDGLHPNVDGVRVIGEALADAAA